jgi:hypothetical protein
MGRLQGFQDVIQRFWGIAKMALSSYPQSINTKSKVTDSEYIVNALPEKFSSQALQSNRSD